MIRTTVCTVALLCFGLTATAPVALAQEDAQPKRYENVDWHSVVLIDFKAGKSNRAKEIISEYFDPASQKSNTQSPRAIEFRTGEWDMMLIWTMDGGPSDMTWEIHPETPAWEKAMTEIAGSEKEAKKIGEEYSSLVARSTSFVGMGGRYGTPIAGN